MTKKAPKSVTPRNKRVQILKTGSFTDMSGTPATFAEADLDRIVGQINAQVQGGFEPPVCKGHPKHDDPRFGSVKGAVKDGGKAYVIVDELSPTFAEECQRGEYKYVSPAFYANGSLRHLGVLGAMNPAIKGMEPIAFGEGMFAEMDAANGTEGLLVFQEPMDWQSMFGNSLQRLVWKIQSMGDVLRGQRNSLIEEKGLEYADKVLPEYAVSNLEKADDVLKEYKFGEGDGDDTDPTPAPPTPPVPPAPAVPDPQLSTDDAEKEQLRVQLAQAQKLLKDKEQAEKQKAFGEKLDSLAAEGRVTPATRVHLEKIHMAVLALPLDGEGMFGEGDDRRSPEDMLTPLLASLPRVVAFGEHAPPAPPASTDPVQVSQQITAHIASQKAQGRELSFAEASFEVTQINRRT